MLDGTSKIQIKRKFRNLMVRIPIIAVIKIPTGIYGGAASVTAAIDQPLSCMPPRNHSDTARDYPRLHGLRVRFLLWA